MLFRSALAAFFVDPEQYDAVITDESMPGTSGSELIRKMRAIRPTMPVVLMSGHRGATVAKALESGLVDALGAAPEADLAVEADEVLQKPLSARDLATSVARVLRL